MSKLSAAMALAIVAIAVILLYRTFDKQDTSDVVDTGKAGAPSSVESPPQQTTAPPPLQGEVFADGKLARRLDMGVDSEEGCRDWVAAEGEAMKMAYPGGERCGSWGAVFVTVGRPTNVARKGHDYSQYTTLEVEMRGARGGEQVEIGVKDWKQRDDGLERKMTITASKEWKTHKIRLSDLAPSDDSNRPPSDLTHLYVVSEFVFGDAPQTVYVRRIRFSR